jgi:hypothetical protein
VTHPGDGYTDTPMDPGGETLHSPAEELRGVTVGKLALVPPRPGLHRP